MKDKVKKYFSIPESRRVIYDYIRVLACIGIICLHATGNRCKYGRTTIFSSVVYDDDYGILYSCAFLSERTPGAER